MELQESIGEGPHIQAFEGGVFTINLESYSTSVLVEAEQSVKVWRPQTFADINKTDIDDLLAINPEILLIGTGKTQEFLPPALLAPLFEANIGVEMMDTVAACRTYNLLMSESRQVVAALLPA